MSTTSTLPLPGEAEVLIFIETYGAHCSFSGSSARKRKAADACIAKGWVEGRDYRTVGALTKTGKAALARFRRASAKAAEKSPKAGTSGKRT